MSPPEGVQSPVLSSVRVTSKVEPTWMPAAVRHAAVAWK